MPALPPAIRSPLGPAGVGVLITTAALFGPAAAWSIEVGDAEVIVDRADGATGCPGEEGLRQAIERVGTRLEGPRPSGPLRLEVRIERVGDDFRAEIRAQGRKTGVRTLEVPGPTCEALTDAVAVTLAILMDRELREEHEPPVPVEQPEEPGPEPTPPVPPEVERPGTVEPAASKPAARQWRSSNPTQLGLSLGAAATHGLPLGWSGMAEGGLWVRHESLDVGVGGFWAPTRSAELNPGRVDVRLEGARFRGCGRFWGAWTSVYLAGCAEAAMAQLQGSGRGFATDRVQRRPWYAVGASVRVGAPLSGPLQGTLSAGVLAPLQTESFSVDRVGQAYETDPITFFVGPELLVQIL